MGSPRRMSWLWVEGRQQRTWQVRVGVGDTPENCLDPAGSGVASLLPFKPPTSPILLHADLEKAGRAKRRWEWWIQDMLTLQSLLSRILPFY